MFTLNRAGLELLRETLKKLSPTIRRKFMRKALRKGATIVQKVAATPISVVPVLAKPVYAHGRLIRRPGTLQRNIIIRNSKDQAAQGNVGLFINVKPARGAARGANQPDDPFYWRFVHFGTKKMKARPFLTIGSRELEGPALRAIEASLGPDIQSLNQKQGSLL